MEVISVKKFFLILIAVPFIGIGWFFDLEMSTSTSLSASWVEVNLNYDYMEIGRERNGMLNISIKNRTNDFLELEEIISNVSIFMNPSSPMEYPIKIPPMSNVSLTSFTTPVNMNIEFVFNRGKIGLKFPVGTDYKEKRKDIIERHVLMLTNFLAAVFIFFLVKEMVKK